MNKPKSKPVLAVVFSAVPLTANTSYHTDRDKSMTKQLFIPKKFFENIFKKNVLKYAFFSF